MQTVAIDDEVLAGAEQLAAQRHQTVGQVLSTLVRQSLPQPDSVFETRNGVPLLPRSLASRAVSVDMVKKLEEELTNFAVTRWA